MKKSRILALILAAIMLVSVLAGCSTTTQTSTGTNTVESKTGTTRAIRTGSEAAPLPPIAGKEIPGDKERFDSYVYSVEKLKANYKDVIVLDARTKAEYDKGHLPGAVQAHWQDWSNVQVKQGEKGWAQIFPNEVLKEKIRSTGDRRHQAGGDL